MRFSSTQGESRGRLWRLRWAAIGAAVAVTFGAGGLFAVSAASPESSVVTLEPVRILDTRDPVNVGLAGPFVSPVAQDLKVTGSVATTTGTKTVVPTGATGVFLNVTPVGSTADGFISVRPANATGLPSTSNVNFTTGAINPNAVLVELPVGGADDGNIEITFDAFGAAGPTTDVIVDVVGYSTDAKLKALEAGLATKANSADVYTKAEIDERPFDHLVGGALVLSNGVTGRAFGNVTVSKTATGRYEVVAPGVAGDCNLTIQATALNTSAKPQSRFISAGHANAGTPCTITVDITDTTGTSVDSYWQFTLYQGGAGATALTSSDLSLCVEDATQSCAAD
jgi:hypothetical protein